jgi:hemerythrin-like domain-containing protein
LDAITLLTQDHRTVEELFTRFENSSDAGERAQLVGKMIEELSIHAAIEEAELYPVMHKAFSEDDSVKEAEQEHAEAKAVLSVLAQLSPDNEQFDTMASQLIADVRHHVEEEENELFPQLQEVISAEELGDLGQRLANAKSSAPNKPSAQDLQVLSVDELHEFAQVIEVEGRSDMNKEQLASALAPN